MSSTTPTPARSASCSRIFRRTHPKGCDHVIIAGIGPTIRFDDIARDIVLPEIENATRALSLVDIPKENVGFEAGFAAGTRKPQRLRHTYASQRYPVSKDLRMVQKILGHSRINTTAIYADVFGEDVRNAVEDV